jgi:outer membrane immunogenic protein
MRILDGSVRSLSHDVKYPGTLRGRLGRTPTSGWLIYGTGGLA